jgi:hypothetical protein
MKALAIALALPVLALSVQSAQAAYPQTKPKAGQFCKKAHKGFVAKTATNTKVKCLKRGTRYKWVSTSIRAKVTPLSKARRAG